MCYPTTCRQCGKTTWAGCGSHVDSVKKSVPASQWCGGHETSSAEPASTGFLSRLFGR